MASISNPTISAKKSSGQGDNWDVTVEYDAVFSGFELANFTYRDGFVLWEDDPWDNDQLTGVVAVSVFNPSASPTHRKMTFRISGDTLDTELGQEELFAVVRLRNLDLNILQTKKTGILHLSP
jgi:hypothetical protein